LAAVSEDIRELKTVLGPHRGGGWRIANREGGDTMGLLTFSINVSLDGCADLIDEYQCLVHPRIAGHGPTLESGLPGTRRLELMSAKPLRNGAVAMHYRRASA
jgi:hypothetical protein